MSPSTTTGQIFCVFYAVFGIPLNLVVLNRVGKYMLAIERNISDFLEGKTGRRVRRSLITESNDEVGFRSHWELFLGMLFSAEVYPLFRPPGVLPVWSAALLCHANECVPNARGLDLLPGHLLLLHHPQYHRLWRLCGRYGQRIAATL